MYLTQKSTANISERAKRFVYYVEFIIKILEPTLHTIDKENFESEAFQRVFQYLRRRSTAASVDRFSFQSIIEKKLLECLNMILLYANIIHYNYVIYYKIDAVESKIHLGQKLNIL